MSDDFRIGGCHDGFGTSFPIASTVWSLGLIGMGRRGLLGPDRKKSRTDYPHTLRLCPRLLAPHLLPRYSIPCGF